MTLTVCIKSAIHQQRNSAAAFSLDCDFSIPSEKTTAIFGPSGAGKTTLLRCIAGLEKPSTCLIHFRDERWHDSKTAYYLPAEKRKIGYVFQNTLLFPHLNVLGNLNFAYRRRFNECGPMPTDVTQWFELEALLKLKPYQLSGGQKQRVAIARALLSSPDLLLMDEPLAALDASAKQLIISYLDNIVDQLNIPMLYISHNIQEICRLADQVILMNNGHVHSTGPLIEKLTSIESSMACDDNAFSILLTTIEQHDDQYQLTKLQLASNRALSKTQPQYLYVSRLHNKIGKSLKVHIAARDISISLDETSRSSILNRITGTIEAIEDTDNSSTILRLAVAEQKIVARITRKSLDKLALKIGQSVYIQIKSVALVTS